MTSAIAGYIRCSSIEQATSGLGLAAQRRQIQAYVDAFLPTCTIAWYEDHSSGRTTNDLPQLQAILDAPAAFDSLVVYRLDRLGRNTIELLSHVAALDVAGVRFHSVSERIDTSGPVGRLFLTILAALAQFERDLLIERTTIALAAKRDAGGLVGRPPFGYRGDPLHPDPQTFPTLTAILTMRVAGASLRTIAGRLSVNLSTVRYVARNPWYQSKGGIAP